MTKIHISNGHIIDPANNIDQLGSVYIANGQILSVNELPSGFTADFTIDAIGNIVCPGFIDLNARLREPGQTYKGTLLVRRKPLQVQECLRYVYLLILVQ